MRAIYAAALGGKDAVSELQMTQLIVAAELQAGADNARQAYLRGEVVDARGVALLQNAANRALRALKLDERAKAATGPAARTQQPAPGHGAASG